MRKKRVFISKEQLDEELTEEAGNKHDEEQYWDEMSQYE